MQSHQWTFYPFLWILSWSPLLSSCLYKLFHPPSIDSSFSPYQGSNTVAGGNGQNLFQFKGNAILPTLCSTFLLQYVLYVPPPSKNLISVQKFAKDNKCVLTFDANELVIQDKKKKCVCFRGRSNNGLYPFQVALSSSPRSPTALHSSCASAETWHSRLGHPSISLFLYIGFLNLGENNRRDRVSRT